MTMTPEAALALRQPFPPESVGKLPKGGVFLDYVGHAAVTDRLLTVDPDWNWEPFATDPLGLPLRDQQGNLWIRLTVCGVTRIGVGDGKSLKECIGDAIRNAAMRFGVALDLWAKEGLVEFAQAAREHRVGAPGTAGLRAAVEQQAPAPEPPEPIAEKLDAEPSPKLTARQRGRLFALFTQKGIPEHEQTTGIAHLIGRTPEHRDAITGAEFEVVIAALESRPDVAATA